MIHPFFQRFSNYFERIGVINVFFRFIRDHSFFVSQKKVYL